MKTNKIITALLSLLLLAATAILLASCNKDDDPKESENNNVNPENHSGQNVADSLVRYFNDLEFFQNFFVQTDSLGNFLYRSMGVPLYESDTAHIYIGVDNIDEAVKYFEYALAPDIAKLTSVTNNYTYTLTDTSGNNLGTVSFMPGSGSSVAEITTDAPDLKYFNKVTFMQNSAWPYNSGESVWHKGDVRTFSIQSTASFLNKGDLMHQWVLVREPGNGVPPMWVSTTNDEYRMSSLLVVQSYFPWTGKARAIYDLLSENWNAYQSVLPHIRETLWTASYSIIPLIVGVLWMDFYIDMENGSIDYETWVFTDRFAGGGEGYHNRRYLLKIDWTPDWLVKEPQGIYTITDACYGEPGQSAANLFDNNVQTKWCSANSMRSDASIGSRCWFVEFMTEKPINPTAYYMVTGNDQTAFPGRSPREWNIYAKNNPEDPWILIDSRDNTDSWPERMTDENFWTGWWGVNVGKAKYKYFRLEMYKNWGDDHFQISEFGFQYDENTENDNELYYYVADASEGFPGNLAPCLFDGNVNTKWCVYKGNKNGWGKFSIKENEQHYWYVEFYSSQPIMPRSYCMVTGNDQSVFPGRNPRRWKLYGWLWGRWVLMDQRDNTNSAVEQMTPEDYWTGYWGFSRYFTSNRFRLEMYDNWDDDCFQISEFYFNL